MVIEHACYAILFVMKKTLTSHDLKWIALISMVSDHINKAFLYNYLWNYVDKTLAYTVNLIMYGIGRLAFPLFLFMTVEAYFHTKNKWLYIFTLLFFGVISIPCNNLYHNGYAGLEAVKNTLFQFDGLNVLFSLAFSFGCIWLIDCLRIINEFMSKKAVHWLTALIIGLAAARLGGILKLSYGSGGVLAAILIYLFREEDKPYIGVFLGGLLTGILHLKAIETNITFINTLQCFSSLSAVFVYLYNGERGNIRNKYFFYIFYPVHLAVLGLIAIIIFQ